MDNQKLWWQLPFNICSIVNHLHWPILMHFLLICCCKQNENERKYTTSDPAKRAEIEGTFSTKYCNKGGHQYQP
jgi:hypothetical protein